MSAQVVELMRQFCEDHNEPIVEDVKQPKPARRR
jgi:hypothetical protein